MNLKTKSTLVRSHIKFQILHFVFRIFEYYINYSCRIQKVGYWQKDYISIPHTNLILQHKLSVVSVGKSQAWSKNIRIKNIFHHNYKITYALAFWVKRGMFVAFSLAVSDATICTSTLSSICRIESKNCGNIETKKAIRKQIGRLCQEK